MRTVVFQYERRLFQYSFQGHVTERTLDDASMDHARALLKSAALFHLKTGPPVPLRSWNAEGWYLVFHSPVLTFTTERGEAPPKEVVEWFHQIEALPIRSGYDWPSTRRDVCLGFCYDPVAALGFNARIQRTEVLRGESLDHP